MTALEANDYCDEKRELQEDTDILNGTHTEFDYKASYEEGKKIVSCIDSGQGIDGRRCVGCLEEHRSLQHREVGID